MQIGYVFQDTNHKFTCVHTTIVANGPCSAKYAPDFPTVEAAIEWFLIRYPMGDIVSKQNFEEVQLKLQIATMKGKPPNIFNPEHMTEKPRQGKKTPSGGFQSDFE